MLNYLYNKYMVERSPNRTVEGGESTTSSPSSYYDKELADHCLRNALLAVKNNHPEGSRGIKADPVDESKLRCIACKSIWGVAVMDKEIITESNGCGIVQASIARESEELQKRIRGA